MWYPENKRELEDFIDKSFSQPTTNYKPPTNIHGLIVPHAGYEYSGMIAGKAFNLIKNKKFEKAVILGPSHYTPLNKVVTSEKFETITPLGKIKLFNTGFPTNNIEQEHSINNQIPFLQKLGIKEIMPLMIGEINNEEAKRVAEKISKINAVYIFSTDLSHFLHYDNAIQRDKYTIKIIENIDIENKDNIDACGIYPLLVLFNLCKLLNTRPHLIEYKNSGDITNDKIHGVVGYSSFWF